MSRHTETENRNKFFNQKNLDPQKVVTADLEHGNKVRLVGKSDAGKMIVSCDGLISDEKNLFLSATGADCFLLYFFDPVKNAIGIAHVGWRGLLSGIVENSVSAFGNNFQSNPADVLVGIGRGIRNCHFEISREDVGLFSNYPEQILNRSDNVFVDLPEIIKTKLLASGIKLENIEDCGECTSCLPDKYFSYRRDKPVRPEVMVGYIGMK